MFSPRRRFGDVNSSFRRTLATKKKLPNSKSPSPKKKGLCLLQYIAAKRIMEIRKLHRLTLRHCNLRSSGNTDFNCYRKFENLCAKSSRASARHIGFAIDLKITQTCILHCYSTYCKQIRRKRNCFMVKRLNVKPKRK